MLTSHKPIKRLSRLILTADRDQVNVIIDNMQLAQKIILPNTTPGEQTEIVGPLPEGRFTDLASILNVSLPYIISISGIILFAYLIWGGFDYLTSMGDPKKAEAGKGKITNAIIGFFIIFISYWLVQIVDKIFRLGIYTPAAP